MNKKTKRILCGFGLLLGVGVLSSCTANFCSVEDTAKIMYVCDKGVTKYFSSENKPKEAVELEGYSDVYVTYSYNNSNFLKELVSVAASQSYFIPSIEYFKVFDQKVLESSLNLYDKPIANAEDINGALKKYGYTKFISPVNLDKDAKLTGYENFDFINNSIKKGLADGTYTGFSFPSNDFMSLYKNQMNKKVANYRSCINTMDGHFGNYGDEGETVELTKKDWGYAWSKGFLEGLLIYPIAYLIDTMSLTFGGGIAGLSNGWPQLLSIVIITFLIRGLMMLASFKTTMSQTKMQELSPQLAKLQQKYPNANTNTYEKQRLSQEQMALYKKNKISPFSQIIVMILQFPIFICVWGALSGSSALGTGSFLGVNLSSTISSILFNTQALPSNINGWWTALMLFIIMCATQFLSIFIPQILQKRRQKNVKKLNVSNTANQQQKTMKIVQYVMLVMIVFMGFNLPSAMGVYWILTALFSLLQSLIIHLITTRKKNKKKE